MAGELVEMLVLDRIPEPGEYHKPRTLFVPVRFVWLLTHRPNCYATVDTEEG